MRRVASLVAILLLLVTAAPVLACVTGSAMSHEESACCRAMHHDCGEMAKTGCCRTEFHSGVHPQLAAAGPQLQLAFILLAWVRPTATPLSAIWLKSQRFPDQHSPPGLLIARTTVLRI